MFGRPGALLGAVSLAFLLTAVACGGGGVPTAAPAPPQPVPAAQPAPAAPAPEPVAEPGRQISPPSAPRPAPAAPKASAAGEPKYGGTFILPLRQDPPGAWDITKVTQRFDLQTAGAPLWGSGNLVRECREDVYKICPGLAESWESNGDFTQWTFKIRSNVRWHDGTSFNPEDAKFWLELIAFGATSGEKKRPPAWFKADFGDVQKVEVLEGNRLRVTLARGAPRYLETISTPFWNVSLPRHLAEPRIRQGQVDVTPQDMGWVGTGPFKMLKYEKGTRVQEQRFDAYWEKDEAGRQLPYLDGIDFAVIRDPAAMDAAVRVGRLDGGARVGGYVLTKERKAGYVRDLGDQVWYAEIGGGGGISLGLNMNLLKPGPLQDLRVRRAISLWVDKQATFDAYQGGFGYLATILGPDNPFTSPDFRTWPGFNAATREADRAEAKRLMAQAGYTGPVRLTIPCQTQYLDRCEYFQSQLAGLGIDLKFTILDSAGWSAAVLSLDYDLFQAAAFLSPVPEAQESGFTRYSLSKGTSAKHEDPKVPEFFQRLNATASSDERVKIWRELERYLVLEQVYLVPFSGRLSVVPYRAYVKSLPVPRENTMSLLDFATVWVAK